jgi:hypothetical protein
MQIKFTLTLYKYLAIILILIFFLCTIFYGLILIFFLFSNSWGAPIVLSPSQEKVLLYQGSIKSIESQIIKANADITAAQITIQNSEQELMKIKSLITRIHNAKVNESKKLALISNDLKNNIPTKVKDVESTNALIGQINNLTRLIDNQLEAKLITIDEAQIQRIQLQSALNNATDAKTNLIQLKAKANEFKDSSETLKGGGLSLQSLSFIQQEEMLKNTFIQQEIIINVAKLTIEYLEKSIILNSQFVEKAKASAYYKAFNKPVSVAFVPYSNLNDIKKGNKIYSCYFQFIFCHEVGKVINIFDAEEYGIHPIFKKNLRGKFIEVEFLDRINSQSDVIFFNSKPLLI